ncbi:MAG: nucleotidyltransferase family protein [Peptococcaceae bacterium]|nr:nucleotidyltransferase family protein [Peptococcaceae bacterium]
MISWKKSLILESMPILEAIRKIDVSSLQIALVVDENNILKGTITDGDIRRAILKGISLEDTVQKVMNSNPTTVQANADRDTILDQMKLKKLRQIPVIDEQGKVIGLEILDEMLSSRERDNWVVLMAGGMGTRLGKLTNECPKPLLKVGSKPILETILENFIAYGFRKFYFSVNYKAEMIEAYFGDGSKWGIQIKYIYETKRMGTAGALGLLPEQPDQALIIMNGDLLTKVNLAQLLNFHTEHTAKATMCVREYQFQVPFGVVQVQNHHLTRVEEKPMQKFFVNAGIYVLEPEVLKLIPTDLFYDMPTLFEQLISQQYQTAAFPIREYWLDVGQMSDFEKANGEYTEVFM